MKRWKCIECGVVVGEQHTRVVIEPGDVPIVIYAHTGEPLPCICIPCAHEKGLSKLITLLQGQRR